MPALITDDAISLHYEIYGSGPCDLVLLHGMGGSIEAWRAVLPHIDLSLFRVLVLDFRGHGKSGGDANSFSFARFCADIQTVATAVGIRSAIVVGFSGSCKDAVWLAIEAPDLVHGVILVAPPGLGIVPMPRDLMWPFFEELTVTKKIPAVMDSWLTEKLGPYREAVVRDYADTPIAVLKAAAELWFYGSVEERAALVTQPVLVIAAAREPLGNPDYQRQTTLGSLPHARMEILDCGHWIPFEEPLKLASLIMAFGNSIKGSRTPLPSC